MPKVVLNAEWQHKLNGLNEQMELCDEQGRTLGHFLPADLYRELLLAWSKEHISDDELQRRRNEPGGHTLAEIWKTLGRT